MAWYMAERMSEGTVLDDVIPISLLASLLLMLLNVGHERAIYHIVMLSVLLVITIDGLMDG
jgi:hypothetical protein